ncbi:MAG: glutamine synthetase family protein [Candidatus Micrarchaeia archaeon]
MGLNDLSYVEMQFVDLRRLREIDVTVKRFEESLSEGKVFDGSSVGMAPIQESDLVLKPIPETFFKLPWNKKVGRVLCDIYKANKEMEEHEMSPRFILKKQLQKAKENSFKFFTAVENEFFLLKENNLIDEAGYFYTTPLDKTKEFRNEIFETLTKLGIEVEYMHHEVAQAQGEITLKYQEALKMADTVITFRYIAQNIAHTKGLVFTLMPKVKAGINGSGMHIHLSLSDLKGNNVFYSSSDKLKISKTAKYFIGGVLEHFKALAGIVAPSINSRKRLIPGYEAPINKAWGPKNRSALIRIPAFFSKKSARIEFRMPDSTCNPYLAFASLLACGLEGIEKEIDPGEACFKNTYEEKDYESIPGKQEEIIAELKKDKTIRNTLGKAFDAYVKLMEEELKDYKKENKKWNPFEITKWEIKKYLEF